MPTFFFVLEIDPNAFKSLILSAVEDHFGHKLSPGEQPDGFRRNKEDLYAKVRICIHDYIVHLCLSWEMLSLSDPLVTDSPIYMYHAIFDDW